MGSRDLTSGASSAPVPSFREALQFWWKLGWISFGGPTGQIAIMQSELVSKRRWIDSDRFLHGVNFCMMLPGPEAQQLATYLGWRLHGVKGALAAGILFVAPSSFLLWALSVIYVYYGKVHWVESAFSGVIPAVVAIVLNSLFKLARKTLTSHFRWYLAFLSSVLMSVLPGFFPLIVLSAGLVGYLSSDGNTESTNSSLIKTPLPKEQVEIESLVRTGLICISLWLLPVVLSILFLGWNHPVSQEGRFFSKAAVVTFGGAYAVLPYAAAQAVETYHWLDSDQMLHGYGLAESTPGPLIIVLQFVGFLGAWNAPGPLSSLFSATLGSLMTTWVTFAPSFLYVLVGGPLLARIEEVKALRSALGAISAVVVGVMARFAGWFIWNSILGRGDFSAGQVDYFVLGASFVAFALLRWGKVDVLTLIGGSAVLGVVYHYFQR